MEALKQISLFTFVGACLILVIITGGACVNRVSDEDKQASAETRRESVVNQSQTRADVQDMNNRQTAVSRSATSTPSPTSTPRPTMQPMPTFTPIPVKGLGVTRRSIKDGMQRIDFAFNPPRTTPYRSLYGSSTHQTSNGSVAQIEIFGSENDIREVEFKAFDIDIEPALGAAHTLMVFSLMFPEWEDGAMAQWVADATGRALDGDVVKHRKPIKGGYAQIELFIRGTTLFVDVNVE